MKLANPTLSAGRVAWGMAIAGLLLTACPTTEETPDDSATEGETEDDSDDDDDETSEATTEDASTSSSGTTMDPSDTDPGSTSTTTGDESSSSTTMDVPPKGGLGCGPPPTCDQGEFVGSIRIESADQISEIAGYTSMTGFLEIFESDLECLDFLACMETVGHDMTVFGNDFLLDASGTNQITALGDATSEDPPEDRDGTLVFSQNNAITDLNGFGGLVQTQASMTVSENELMTSISGFGELIGTQRNFTIRFNPVLEDVDGLKDMLFIGAECQVTNNASLCVSDIFEVCGDLKQGPFGGSTANNSEC